jgi:hypothetical protein
LLVEMFTRDGWKALGYSNWGEYLSVEFPEKSLAYMRRLANAGLIEQRMGLPIGSTPESHIRPLYECLTNENEIAEAFEIAQERYTTPTGREYELVAKEMWVQRHAPTRLARRHERGQISPLAAFTLGRLYKRANEQLRGTWGEIVPELITRMSDPELAEMMFSLPDRELLVEISNAGGIPTFEGYVPLDKATAATLQAWLVIDSVERKARQSLHIEQNSLLRRREKMERRVRLARLVSTLLSSLRELDMGELIPDNLDALLMEEIDVLEKEARHLEPREAPDNRGDQANPFALG